MEDILLAHEKAELEMDIEAMMATVSPDCRWEFPSDGLVAIGVEAVREHYRRVLPGAQQWNVAAEKRVYTAGPNALIREAWGRYMDRRSTSNCATVSRRSTAGRQR
jgi:hypothetical protein